MDNFTKGILTVIAVGIIGINLQMLEGKNIFISKAHAIGGDVQKVAICDEHGIECAGVSGYSLYVRN
jgi:hypothetical protein